MPDCREDTEQELKTQEEREQISVLNPVSWKKLVSPTWGLNRSSLHPGLVSLHSERLSHLLKPHRPHSLAMAKLGLDPYLCDPRTQPQ